MDSLRDRLKEWVGKTAVVDCATPYVAVGTLVAIGSDYLELHDADMHDLRDSTTTREMYLVKMARHGVQQNRSVLLVRMAEMVGISRLEDVAIG